MEVRSTHTYAAPPAVVFTMMTDPEVLTAKYTALGHEDVGITEHEIDGGVVTVCSKRRVPMDVPGFAKRFISPTNTVEQRDHWDEPGPDGTRTGTWRVDAAGVPVTVGGTLRITPGPKRTTMVEITGEVRSSVPIVGGKLTSFVAGDVRRTIAAEEAFNDDHLSSRKSTRRP
jgi:hypothetical protein